MFIAIVLALVTFALYARGYDHEFVNADDHSYILRNPPVLEGLTGESVAWAFTESHSANWHPLTWISHMLDVELFELDAGKHHLMGAALHALGSALLFLALVALTRKWGASLVVAALFALHPTHVESVAWASERKDVLSGIFWMLTLLAYASYARRPALGRYLLVALALALGLMSKPMVVVLPPVLLLMDAWPLGRWKAEGGLAGMWRSARPLFVEKIPLFAMVAASAFVTTAVQSADGATRSMSVVDLPTRFANTFVACGHYLLDTVWPVGLAIFYPHPAILTPDDLGGLYGLAAGIGVALLVVTLLVVRAFRRAPYLAIGWFWYLGTLVPVIGIVQVGSQARADRYLYLPAIGLYIALVWGVAALAKRMPRGKMIASGLAAAALIACAVLSWFQIGTWRNDRTLFSHAVEVTNDNYVAWSNLGLDSARNGDLQTARLEYQTALRIVPDHIDALNNLGVIQMRLGRLDEARRLLRQATRVDPTKPDAFNNLGNALLMRGDATGALVPLREALRLAPGMPDALYNYGRAQAMLGNVEEARRTFEELLRVVPGHPGARQELGKLGGD